MAYDNPESAKEITYEVRGKVAIITINRPKDYGAMNYTHYRTFEEHLYRAAEEPSTTATILQGTGKFFSAGADVNIQGNGPTTRTISGDGVDMGTRHAMLGPFAGRNSQLAETLWTHPKLLVCALNGPVIGLSAAIAAACDLIVGRDSTFLLVPFANLSLVSEGGAGYTLPQRLGWSLANQALLTSQPISAKDLLRVGFLNWTLPDSVPTPEFNNKVYQWVTDKIALLDPESILRIKQLIRLPYTADFNSILHKEAVGGVHLFARGRPQEKFRAMAEKSRRHKL